jgi:hypothetical protein
MMGAAMFSGIAIAILMGLPTLTYFQAKQMGRNPKKWFLIGLLLPGIASVILSCLPDLSTDNPKTPEPQQ